MNLPFEYDRLAVGEFGGTTPDHHRLRARPRRHPAGSARPHDVVRGRHAQRAPRDPRRLVAHGAVGRGNRDRRPQHRHLHAAGDGVSVRDDGRGDARRSGGSRPSSCRATSFRSCSAASTRSRRRSSPRVAAKHPGLSVLQIDAHADLRDSFMGTPHNHACAMRRVLEYARDDAGRHPQPVAGGGRRRCRRCRPTIFYDFNMRQDARLDRSRRRLAQRDGVHHDRLRRPRSGDHAGGRHAGAGRAVVVRNARAAPPRDRVAAASSAATSSSCVRCPATSRRTSSARS